MDRHDQPSKEASPYCSYSSSYSIVKSEDVARHNSSNNEAGKRHRQSELYPCGTTDTDPESATFKSRIAESYDSASTLARRAHRVHVDPSMSMPSKLEMFLSTYYPIPLRPYQLRAVAGLTAPFVRFWSNPAHHRRTESSPCCTGGVVHLRTGAGKTDIAVAVALVETLFPFYAHFSHGPQADDLPIGFSPRDIVMLTPTRVLTDQQSLVFARLLVKKSVTELLKRAEVSLEVQTSTGGSFKTVAMGNSPEGSRRRAHVRILVATPGRYQELVEGSASLVAAGVPPAFPVPERCSTVFFDEVHHCAASHPFSHVAKMVQAIIAAARDTETPSVRMVGLTATLTYARTVPTMEAPIRSLFVMLQAPLRERYWATDQELKDSNVPEPPQCQVLDFGVDEMQSDVLAATDPTTASFSVLAGLEPAPQSLSSDERTRHFELLYPRLLIPYSDVSRMMDNLKAAFPLLESDADAFDGPDVVFSFDDPATPTTAPRYTLMDQSIHLYSKHIYLLTLRTEAELGLAVGKRSQIGLTPLRELVKTAIAKLRLLRERFMTADHRQLMSMHLNGSQAATQRLSRGDAIIRGVGELKGELLCHLYQAMRLILSSKQRDLEIAVRYLHRGRCVFDALGLGAFLDVKIPLYNPKTGAIAFKDCERVVNALRTFSRRGAGSASPSVDVGADFRTIIFCESALSVAVLAEYVTSCFAEDDMASSESRLGGGLSEDDGSGEEDDDLGGKHIRWRGTDYLFRADWLASTGNDPAFNIPHRSETEQDDVVSQFREGLFNVLCATTVVEEGLDVSTVRCIIHLSPPTNPVVRARADGRSALPIQETLQAELLQSQVAYQLAFAPDAHLVPTVQSKVDSQPVQSSRKQVAIPSRVAAMPKALAARLAATNPVSALNELWQRGHCSKSEEECEEKPYSGDGGFLYTVTLRFQEPPMVIVGPTIGNKKEARARAARKALAAILSS